MIGLGLIIFEFTMHPTLLNPKSVEEDLGLEMLGIVPQDHAYFQRKGELLSRESAVDSTVEQSFASAAYILCNRLEAAKRRAIVSMLPQRKSVKARAPWRPIWPSRCPIWRKKSF